jgi:hypothetical protein
MQSTPNSKKGMQLSQVPGVVIMLVVIAIILSIGPTILTQIQGTQTSGGFAYNATQGGLQAIDAVSKYQPTWGIVIAAAVVIGIVVGALMYFGKK